MYILCVIYTYPIPRPYYRMRGFPSKTAVLDFFKVHGIDPPVIAIDKLSAYWKKTENVDIQYWRYEKSDFKPAADTKKL